MKKIFYLCVSILLLGCSAEDSPQPEPTPEPVNNPVAKDDSRTAVENEETVFEGLVDNDEVVDGARIKNFDTQTTKGGTIEDNRDGTYTYKPAEDFVGEDSFSYSLCVPGDSKRCSTAEVSITVEDAGSPEAIEDSVNVLKGTSTTFSNLTVNDKMIDGATISSVSDANSTGSVVLNDDGSVTYTSGGNSGEDTFTYTLCDNDQPEATCSTATVTVTVAETIAFNIPAELKDYYSNFAMSTSREINYAFISNFTIDKHTNILSYGQRHDYLYEADEDLDNPDNVILMYSGESRYWEEYTSDWNDYEPQTFNTEHIYPQSKLDSELAVTDLHHLRAADDDVNLLRYYYPYADGSGEYGLVTEETFYPGDDWKGDVARMVMYINIRYGENFDEVGGLDLFLKWNVEDPVSAFELHRNNVIESVQGNRNPFIDNPYLATLIWGGPTADNKWQ